MWLGLLVLLPSMALLGGGCNKGDDEPSTAKLIIEIHGNCRSEGTVRVQVDGVHQLQLSAGESKIVPAVGGTHHIKAVSDAGRVWNQVFTVTRYESTLVLTCD